MGLSVRIQREDYEKIEQKYKMASRKEEGQNEQVEYKDLSGCKLIVKGQKALNDIMSQQVSEDMMEYFPSELEFKESSKNEITLDCEKYRKKFKSGKELIEYMIEDR